jgi:hypothetical protein
LFAMGFDMVNNVVTSTSNVLLSRAKKSRPSIVVVSSPATNRELVSVTLWKAIQQSTFSFILWGNRRRQYRDRPIERLRSTIRQKSRDPLGRSVSLRHDDTRVHKLNVTHTHTQTQAAIRQTNFTEWNHRAYPSDSVCRLTDHMLSQLTNFVRGHRFESDSVT